MGCALGFVWRVGTSLTPGKPNCQAVSLPPSAKNPSTPSLRLRSATEQVREKYAQIRHCVTCADSTAKLQEMAIFHARMQVIGRSTGRSAVAAAAYRAAERLHDARQQR